MCNYQVNDVDIGNLFEKRIQELCNLHNLKEPSITWKNGGVLDFLIDFNPIQYREPNSGRIISAIPRMHGHGDVMPYHISIDVYGVFRTGKGLIQASELDEQNGSLRDILQKKTHRVHGTEEELIEGIEAVMQDIGTRLLSLERIR